MDTLLQILINGISTGAVYGLVALGYTLVFSVLGVINFAHGAVFTLGAYLTYLLLGGAVGANGLLAGLHLPFALPFWAALPIAGLLTALVSLGVEASAFRPLRRQQAEPLLYLITSLGAGVILVNLLQILLGAEGYSLPPQRWAACRPPCRWRGRNCARCSWCCCWWRPWCWLC